MAESSSLGFSEVLAPGAAGGRACPRRGAAETLTLAAQAVFTGADLAEVRPVTKRFWLILSGAHETSEVVLTFRPAARARVAQSSAGLLGRTLAIVLRGEVVGTLIVTAPLDTAELRIAGVFTRAEARALARELAAARG